MAAPLHLDRPRWANAGDFCLDDHLRRISLPGPATWDRLRTAVQAFFEAPLDLSRPPFEVALVEDVGGIEGLPAGAFALVTKVHHAALDGISAVEVMKTFCDANAACGESEFDPEDTEPEPSAAALLWQAGLNQLDRGASAARLAATPFRLLARSRREPSRPRVARPEARPVPATRFNGRPSSSRVFGGCHLDLARVQAVRSAVPGATVNDVILTIVGGALRRVLSEDGQLPHDPIAAMAPISIRPSEASDGSGQVGGNRVSTMVVGLGTDVADPLERLEAVRQLARSSKESSSAAGSSTMLDIANVIPSALGELLASTYRRLGLSSLHGAIVNCVVTNVPGPKDPLFLAGSRMVACYGFGPIFDGVGLIHPVLSYAGGITISFTSCPEMLPDPARYEECLHESFEQLAAAVGLPAAPESPAAEAL